MNIREELARRVLIFDGGMGTMLQAAGLPAGYEPERWNLERPDAVQAVHAQYLAAGADIVTTNTFGANAVKLAGHPVEAIVTAAVGLARQAVTAHGSGFVALDVGPTGRLLRPMGDLPFEEAVAAYAPAIRAGAAAGADLVLELPSVWAVAPAETFARGSAEILHAAGATALSFGSETGDGAALEQVAQVLDDPAFSQALQPFLSRGLPFAQCRHRAVQELLGEEAASCLANANDNLGVEYLRAARRLGWSPKVYPVLRVGAGHDGGDHPQYPSASHVRGEIRAGAVAMDNPAFLSYNQRGMLARLRCLELEDWERIPDCGEGLAQRLYGAPGHQLGGDLRSGQDQALRPRPHPPGGAVGGPGAAGAGPSCPGALSAGAGGQ